uniref:Uncharacterized protein n=1 Tax=Bodo saltans TaxID=75058 RepID=B6DT81_BODSA|nr:hypothetical protein [Bodo saltans]
MDLVRIDSVDVGAPPHRQATSEPPPGGSFVNSSFASFQSPAAAAATDSAAGNNIDYDDVRPPSSVAPSPQPHHASSSPSQQTPSYPGDSSQPLVPAQVLDEANATITLLMEELERLHAELDEMAGGGGGRKSAEQRTKFDRDDRVVEEAAGILLSSPKAIPFSVNASTIDDTSSGPIGGGLAGQPLQQNAPQYQSARDVDSLKRTVQQRNRVIQQLQKQLTACKSTEASLQSELASALAEIEKHKKREQTLVSQTEHLRRDIAARDNQLEATRQSTAEMLLGLEARFIAWRAHEQTSIPALTQPQYLAALLS